jgi:hypothetical protein
MSIGSDIIISLAIENHYGSAKLHNRVHFAYPRTKLYCSEGFNRIQTTVSHTLVAADELRGGVRRGAAARLQVVVVGPERRDQPKVNLRGRGGRGLPSPPTLGVPSPFTQNQQPPGAIFQEQRKKVLAAYHVSGVHRRQEVAC